MTKRLFTGFVMCGLVAGVASAATVWNPAANGIVPPATGDWSDPANWTNGLPDGVEKAVFNVPGAAECVVTTALSGMQIVQGDGNLGEVLRVASSGNLSTKAGVWSAVGYNNPAHAIVEAGGIYSFGQHMWVGLLAGATGTLDIHGTVNVGGQLGLGWNGGVGFANVEDGGLLALQQIHGDGSSSIKAGSMLSINGTGRVTKTGNFESVLETYASNGRITGNGILGNVDVSYDSNADLTTVIAIPEPSALGLLGFFGVIGLLRRRRP